MGTPRRTPTRSKTPKRLRAQSPAVSPIDDLPTRHRRVPREAFRPPVRTEWASFVVHCVRTWIASAAAGATFLSVWKPRDLPALHPARPERARRRGSATSHLTTRRPPYYPVGSTAALLALPGSWGEAALRSQYPLVNALLVELAAARSADVADVRTQRGG